MKNSFLRACGSCVVAAGICIPVVASASPSNLALVGVMNIPGQPMNNFDIGFVDSVHNRYYFADRSNKSVDVFDTITHKFLFHVPGFVGTTKPLDIGGPNGVLVIPEKNQLWAGDGNSTAKVFDISSDPPRLVATINTGGTKRVDEMTYDPKDHLVVVSNDSDTPPFMTFISTEGSHPILGKLALPDATDGFEQPRYNSMTGMIYQSVPIYKNQNGVGGFAVVNPATFTLDHMILVDNCQPAGNVQGPGYNQLMACKAGAKATKLPAQSLVVNVQTGQIVQAFPQVGGSDEAWYDPTTETYYLAARGNPGGPVLGEIDAATNTWIANIPTAPNSHSVAASQNAAEAYVPMQPNPACSGGCVGVYATK